MAVIKKYGIWICLALTLMATYWTSIQDSSDDKALLPKLPPKLLSQRHVKPADLSIAVEAANTEVLMQRPQINDSPVNLFSTLEPPQALATNESLAAPPQAPANPYSYAGKVVEDGQVMVFLTDGANNHVVKTGDVIDGVWKVQSIRPPQLFLKYMPLKTEVSIEIGVLS
jgi:hypothetical protein